jgi:hypothetical protein
MSTGNLLTQWNNNTLGNTISGLKEGDYTITVSYQQQCSTSKTISIQAPDSIQIGSAILPETDDEGDGEIRININGGTPPYYVSWPEQMTTGTILSGLSTGSYPLFIADAKGCIYRDTVQVGRFISPIKEEGMLTLIPNPGQGYIKIGEEVNGMENCLLRIFDMLGRLTYETPTTISSLMTSGLDLHHYADGTYLLQVSDEDQIFQQRAIIIR